MFELLCFAARIFYKECICTTALCKAASSADHFLFPFDVDFCLVSSCLLYVMWKNVGTEPKVENQVVKPSYKLYKSYKGKQINLVFTA